MKKIWVVEQGSYSDYHVVGVYSSKVNADKIAELLNAKERHDEAEVAEWILDPAIEELRSGYTLWRIVMLRDGDTEGHSNIEFGSYNVVNEFYVQQRSKAPAYMGQGISDCLQATVWARDLNHAVKIVNEHRTMLIAEGKWK
jgi:hypothetical protein